MQATTTSPAERVAHHELREVNEAALITLTRPLEWHSWEFGGSLIASVAWRAIVSWPSLSGPGIARSRSCGRHSSGIARLSSKRAYDLDYLGILTDWHTRHSPERVVWDCQRAYALLCGAAAGGITSPHSRCRRNRRRAGD
jgi:hypothetical protein